VRVGGIPYLDKMKLYIVSDLDLSLKIKDQESCPHIHLIVEPKCDAFTTSMVWLEVLCRGGALSRQHGTCVISYTDHHFYPKDSLSKEDVLVVQKIQKNINEDLKDIEIINL
jgi:hypothetical protein